MNSAPKSMFAQEMLSGAFFGRESVLDCVDADFEPVVSLNIREEVFLLSFFFSSFQSSLASAISNYSITLMKEELEQFLLSFSDVLTPPSVFALLESF